METQEITQRLESEMIAMYQRIPERVKGYRPIRFINMVRNKGGFKTAVDLLTSNLYSDGFTRLAYSENQPELILEYLVYHDEEFRTLFSPQVIINIERKLGYQLGAL